MDCDIYEYQERVERLLEQKRCPSSEDFLDSLLDFILDRGYITENQISVLEDIERSLN